MRKLWAVPTVGALFLGAACGDDGGEADEPTDRAEAPATSFEGDACDLLTDEQVAEVLGDDVEEDLTPSGPEIEQPATCTWSVPGASVDFADPQPTGITAFQGDRAIFDNTRILAEEGDDFEELDDLGDEAYAGNGVGGLLLDDIGITVTPIGTDSNAESTHDLIVDLLGTVAENL